MWSVNLLVSISLPQRPRSFSLFWRPWTRITLPMCWPSSVLQFAPRACLLYTETLMTGGYNYLVFAILACFVKASLWGTQEMKTRQCFFLFPSHPGLLGKGGRIARVLFFLSTHFNLFCLSLIFLKESFFLYSYFCARRKYRNTTERWLHNYRWSAIAYVSRKQMDAFKQTKPSVAPISCRFRKNIFRARTLSYALFF